MSNLMVYQTVATTGEGEGESIVAPVGHFATEKATIRKYPSDLSKTKEFRFIPVDDNGNAVRVARYNLDSAQSAAYMAASDSDARMAVLASVKPLFTSSAITPTRAQVALMRALVDRDTLADNLASGILIRPTERAETAAKTAKANAKLTEAERTAAALDALFSDAEPTPEPDAKPAK